MPREAKTKRKVVDVGNGVSRLGVAICKGLVEAHGGSIRTECEGTGRGTRVTLTIPPRQSRLRSRTVIWPIVPCESSDGLAKLPHCRVRMFNASASVSLPSELQNALPSREWHLRVGSHKQWLPRPRRITSGCLVFQSVGTTPNHAVKGRLPSRLQWIAGTKAAPTNLSCSLAAALLHTAYSRKVAIAPGQVLDWRKSRSELTETSCRSPAGSTPVR